MLDSAGKFQTRKLKVSVNCENLSDWMFKFNIKTYDMLLKFVYFKFFLLKILTFKNSFLYILQPENFRPLKKDNRIIKLLNFFYAHLYPMNACSKLYYLASNVQKALNLMML